MTGSEILTILWILILILNVVYVIDTRSLILKVQDQLNVLTAELKPINPAQVIEFYITNGGQKTKVVTMNLKDTDKVSLSLAIKDAKGNPAQVDGAPVWSVTDPSLASLNVAADGMSADLLAAGPLGSFQVQVNADADLGSGVSTILGTLDVTIIPGDAVEVDISAGAPSAQ